MINMIKGDSPLDVLYRERLEFEQTISKQFYHRYKAMRIELFEHLKEENPGQDPLLLISKTQKLLDRFIFVCFCEDANEYITRYIVKEAIGGWLDDRKRELGFYNLPELTPGDMNKLHLSHLFPPLDKS